MAIPPKAYRWSQAMDPADRVEFIVEMGGADALLEPEEEVDELTLTLLPEAVLLGLTIETDAYAMVQPTPSSLKIWFTIDPAYRSSSEFDGDGVSLPMELTVVTTSNPPRTRQRTLVLQVAQQ